MCRLVPALIMAVAAAGGAHAACAQFTASPINVTYDPLGAQGVSQVVRQVTLMASRNENTVTEGSAQFVDQNSGTLRVGTGGPVYTVEESQKVVAVDRSAAPANPANSFPFRFSGSGSAAEPVYGVQFVIDPGQDVPAGVFSESLDMQMRCGGSDGNQPVDLQSGVLHVTVDVPSTLIASLAGGSASGTLDFGDFAGLTRTAMVNVYSTGPYALSIASENNGVMKLEGAPPQAADSGNARIGYTLTFNGRPVPAGTNVHFGRTGVGGSGLALSITAEPVASKHAGVYRDSITLTFTPLATL
jgi:hypothetical protein